MSQRYEKLKTLLKELFQLDKPDLDFGFYRVMHAKSTEVTQFLDEDLLPQVKEAFAQYRPADKAAIEKELAELRAGIEKAGMDPADSPKVAELERRLAEDAVDLDALEAEVYDHLYGFFRRYYSEGDFLSKRVYKPGVYAIPYEGEEVKLHWANADQYYIKTSEYLRDYAFRLRPEDESNPMRVHFRLVDAAEGEHGNVKEARGKERRFALVAASPVAVENGELVVRFTYEPAAEKQKELNAAAEESVLKANGEDLVPWIQELGTKHIRADGSESEHTRFRVHLDRYTARNTFDYFIHKDLAGFLRRELDFYIKNEVMHLGDIESESAPRVEQYLSKIKVIRQIAGKIITFLAQLEDFQKKLWLKKKFVVETSWCVRVGCVPDAFLDEIAANEAQVREWVDLCAIDEIEGDLAVVGYTEPLRPEFLSGHPTLMLDTRHFDADFTARLVQSVGDLAEATDAVLFHSENWNALKMLERHYAGRVASVYIDPPYNTDAGPIDYKNGYRSSSWMSMIADRLAVTARILTGGGILCVTIDDYEVHSLAGVLEQEFGREALLGTVVIRNNPSGRSTVEGLSVCHEYAFFYSPGDASLSRLPRSEKQLARFTMEDGRYVDWRNFRKDGGAVTYRTARPKQHYPIYVDLDREGIRIPEMSWDRAGRTWNILEPPTDAEVAVWPIDANGKERVWSLNHSSAREQVKSLEVRPSDSGAPQIFRRHLPADGVLPRSWWDNKTYAAREYGSAALRQLFGEAPFSFAKSPFAVADCLRVAGMATSAARGTVVDYFAGSGTTGHAVINLNRGDGGRRRFILVEMGDYFDTVLLPRLKKVTFSPEWSAGKPTRLAAGEEADRSPRIMKVVRLESYEDALNNLELRRSPERQAVLDMVQGEGTGALREEFLLHYMLDVETRGSPSLLNVEGFVDPLAYRLSVKRPGSDESREVNVDLLETFNWLVGLTVRHIVVPQTFEAAFERDEEGRLTLADRLRPSADGLWWFRSVIGTTPDGRNALIIWRKRPGGETAEGVEQDNLVLDEWFTKQGYSSKDSEFDVIWVNGGNNLENLKAPDDTWKVRLLEDDFHRLMFDVDGV